MLRFIAVLLAQIPLNSECIRYINFDLESGDKTEGLAILTAFV